MLTPMKVLNLHKRYVELKDWAEKLRVHVVLAFMPLTECVVPAKFTRDLCGG